MAIYKPLGNAIITIVTIIRQYIMTIRHIGLCISILNSRSKLFKLLYPIGFLFDKLLKFDAINTFHMRYSENDSPQMFYDDVYQYTQLKTKEHFNPSSCLPASGPIVVVCNHPTGFFDIITLSRVLFRCRKDIKILGNEMVYRFPIAKNHLIPINVFNRSKTLSAVKECQSWLEGDGVLLIFPAGEVSDFCRESRSVIDSTWSSLPIRLAKKTKASMVAFHIEASNSKLFYLLSRINRYSRLGLFAHELFNKKKNTFHLYKSSLLNLPFNSLHTDQEATNFLKLLCECLKYQSLYQNNSQTCQKNPEKIAHASRVNTPTISTTIIDEINNLSDQHKLIDTASFTVYTATSRAIPQTLRYIQYLREVTFSQEAMGTGHALDADCWDDCYHHIFIWDQKKSQVVGACRISTLSANAPSYLATLYNIDHYQLKHLGVLGELSRSIIAPEYQKNYRSLLYLWRGISQFILYRSQITHLIGLVSIPDGVYSKYSLDIIYHHLVNTSQQNPLFVDAIKPKQAYHPTSVIPAQLKIAIGRCQTLMELEVLMNQVADANVSFPVLFRQYESVGSLPIHMSTDSSFSNCIDILQVWNIDQPKTALLKRLFGEEGFSMIEKRVSHLDG